MRGGAAILQRGVDFFFYRVGPQVVQALVGGNIAHGLGLGFDLNQSQFLEVEAFSQEVRIESPANEDLSWMFGGYLIATERYISTGNMRPSRVRCEVSNCRWPASRTAWACGAHTLKLVPSTSSCGRW